jgi:hypothetical protein
MELAEALPRKIGKKDHRYQYIERILGNVRILMKVATYSDPMWPPIPIQHGHPLL